MNDPTKLIKCAYDIFERCNLIGKIGGDGVVSCLKDQYKYYTYSRGINSSLEFLTLFRTMICFSTYK